MSRFVPGTAVEELLFVFSALEGIFRATTVAGWGQQLGRQCQIRLRSAQKLPDASQVLYIRPGASQVHKCDRSWRVKGCVPCLVSRNCLTRALWHCLLQLLSSRLLSLIALDLQSVTSLGGKSRNSSRALQPLTASCYSSCPAAVQAVPCSTPGKGEQRRGEQERAGEKFLHGFVQCNSCVGRMKASLRRDPASKLCVDSCL